MKIIYKFDDIMYKKRIIVENTFAKIKMFRRLMIRYDFYIETYIAFLYMGISKLIHNYMHKN